MDGGGVSEGLECDDQSRSTANGFMDEPRSGFGNERSDVRIEHRGIVGDEQQNDGAPTSDGVVENDDRDRWRRWWSGENDDDDDDFLHRAGSSAEEVEAAEMKVYEQYVMGMLTNFPSMPIERIHNMLKMFVVEPAYDKTQAQLEKFLMSLVRAEKLAHDGENFSKRKE